ASGSRLGADGAWGGLEATPATARVEIDGDNLDPAAHRQSIVGLAISFGQTNQTPLLRGRQRFARRSQSLAASAAHLDKGKQVILFGDDVDLPLSDAKVALANAISLRQQVLDRQALAEIPEYPARRGH